MFAALMDELIVAAMAPELAKPAGIIVLGSNGSWVVAAPAAEGESMAVAPPLAEATLLAAALAPCTALVPDVPDVDEELVMS